MLTLLGDPVCACLGVQGAMHVGALLAGTGKNAKQDLEALHEWMEEMQEDGGRWSASRSSIACCRYGPGPTDLQQ